MTKRAWSYLLIVLVLVNVVFWYAVLYRPTHKLRVVACDVGQGDAYLVTIGSFQALVDGGPNNKVVECLSKYSAFWDRTIEVVILTHPDADHYTGLVEVLKRYNVSNLVYSDASKNNSAYGEFLASAQSEGARRIKALAGAKIVYGNLYFVILSPSNTMFAEGIEINEESSNDYSVITHLVYGGFSALFTGDLTPKITQNLIGLNQIPDVDYLSVPHHGSKNGLTEELLRRTSPSLSVISVGAKNRYGHPHESILNLLSGYDYLRTDEAGDVVVESNGSSWKRI